MANVIDNSPAGAGTPSSQLAIDAALADWVYHRDSRDQSFSLGEISAGLTAQLFDRILAATYGFVIANDGFIYNPATGFAAAVVWDGTTYTAVFRGTDLATSDGPKIVAASQNGGVSSLEVDGLDARNDAQLASGTLQAGNQDNDALNLVRMIKATDAEASIRAVGQSLGGGLAGIVSSVFGIPATMIDPAPFARQIYALAVRAALDIVRDDRGAPLLISNESIPLAIDEIRRNYSTDIYSAFLAEVERQNSNYASNLNGSLYSVRDEVLSKYKGFLFYLGSSDFSLPRNVFDAGAANGFIESLALHNPALFALIARTESADDAGRFAKLLRENPFLHRAFLGDEYELTGAQSHARSDDANVPTTSRVGAFGPDPTILERAFFKSIGSQADIYKIFYKLFNETLDSGAASASAKALGGASIHDGISKLILGAMRDVVNGTETLDQVANKLATMDFGFTGETSTNYSRAGLQDKIVVKLSDITGTGGFQAPGGLPAGVNDLDRFVLGELEKDTTRQKIEEVLEAEYYGLVGTLPFDDGAISNPGLHGNGLGWEILVAQAGRDGADLEYMASEAGNSIRGKSHLILGGTGEDTLGGSSERDFILGGDGEDSLLGGRGDDVLVGGDKEDILDGGSGNSVYKGGGGDDTFVIGAHMGRIDIMDVEDGDRLVLRLPGTADMPSRGYVLTGGLVNPFSIDSDRKVAVFSSLQLKYLYEIDHGNDTVYSSGLEEHYAPGTSAEDEFQIRYTLDTAKEVLEIEVVQAGVESGSFRVRIPNYTEGMLGLRFEEAPQYPIDAAPGSVDEWLAIARGFEEIRFAQALALLSTTELVDLPDALDAGGGSGSSNRLAARFAATIEEGRDDTINIGARDDVLYGYGGNDTYVYTSSAAHEVRIEDIAYRTYDNSADKLSLEGLTFDDVTISRLEDGDDAVVTLKATGATITLAEEFGSSSVEAIEFGDGRVLDLDDIKQATIDYALANVTVSSAYGFDDRDDLFEVGTQAKTLVGMGGNDTYRYIAAGGADIVVQDDWFGTPSSNDKLVLVDLNPADVTISREGDSEDAVLTVVASGRTITLAGQFSDGTIETVVFADGTTWTTAVIRQMLLDQASVGGGDTLHGFDGADDMLVADGVHSTLAGYGGADTYVYSSSGTGLRIVDQPSYGDDSPGDELIFADLDADDLAVTRPGNGLDAALTIASSGSTVTIEGQFGYGEIEIVRFADGTSWSAAQIRQMVLAAPNAAASGTVSGFNNGDDLLKAGSGDKTLVGYGGSDTYVYTAATDGNLTVSDQSFDPNGLETDVLRLTDVLETGVSVTRTGASGDAVLQILSTGKSIVLRDQFTYYPVEQVEFADGTTWSAAQIREKVLAQANASGFGSTYGFEASDDTLLSAPGGKTLRGYSGSDTYVFENGVHSNTVIDDGDNGESIDKLILKGVAPGAVSASRPDQTGTVVLTLAPYGSTVTIVGQLGGTGIELVQFDDGTTWTAEHVEELILGPKNKAPTTTPLALTGTEDVALTISAAQILAGVLDPDGDQVVLDDLRYPTNGSVAFAADGSVVFTPDAEFVGKAGFTYTVTDGRGGTATGQVTIDLSSVNDAPTGSSSLLRVREDAPAAGRVTGSDVDGDALSFTLKTGAGPANGQVELAADGTFLYTPTANLNGSDTFTVVVTDGRGGLKDVVVAVQIAAQNDAPTAAAPSESVEFGMGGIAAGTLLAGADVDGDALAFRIVEGSAYGGTVALDPSTGVYAFTAEEGYLGPARFAYVVSDGLLESTIKFVDIAITSDNAAPAVAAAMAIQVDEDASGSGIVSASDPDGDALTYAIKNGAGPLKGTVAFATGGAFTYTPAANAVGSDVFTVLVSDGQGGAAEQVVSVAIVPVNDAPTAAASSSLQATEDTIASGTITAADVDGDDLSYAVKPGAGPAKGAIAFGQSGAFTYTPAADANGADTFTVVVSDGHGGSVEQIVSLAIAAVNDAPTAAVTSSLQVTEDAPAFGLVAAADVDGDVLGFAVKSGAGPTKGSVSFGAEGRFTYTPAANANGADTFTVSVSDGHGGSVEQVVSVGVAAVNDAPTVVADVGGAGENEAKVFDLLANDMDADPGDSGSLVSFIVRSVDGVPGGLSVAAAQTTFSIQNGKLSFDPGNRFDALAAGQFATVVVDYVVEDAAHDQSIGTFTLTVGGVDEALIVSTDGDDILVGTAGADQFDARGGNDTIAGERGDDVFYGGSGADSHDGGDGFDTVDYSSASAAIVLDLATPSNSTGDAFGDTFAFVERFKLSASDDRFVGSARLDITVHAGAGNDTLIGGAADEILDGGSGWDVVEYDSLVRSHALAGNRSALTLVSAAEGTDTLTSVEAIEFIDGRTTFDVNDHAAMVYRMYETTLARAPEGVGLNYWTDMLDQGASIYSIADMFMSSAEFQSKYGALSNQNFIEQLYQNVLHRASEPIGLEYWTSSLNNGSMTRSTVVTAFSESAEHVEMLRTPVEAGLWDQDETATSVARLYYAALDRAPDAGGLIAYTKLIDNGSALADVADMFAGSAEFQSMYGGLSNRDFIGKLYLNVFDRSGEDNGVTYYTDMLDSGQSTRGSIALVFSQSTEFQSKTQPYIDGGILFT